MAKKIRVLVVEPGEAPVKQEIESDYRVLRKIVGGFAQIVCDNDTVCHINDERAVAKGKPFTLVATPTDPMPGHIYGTFILAGYRGKDICELSDEDMAFYLRELIPVLQL